MSKTKTEENSITHNENDVLLRLVECWYDTTWAYFIEKDSEKAPKRLEKRKRSVSSSASVCSVQSDGSIMGKTMQEKLHILERLLREVEESMTSMDFQKICSVCMEESDQVYPGFKDILLIVRYLLRETDPYRNMLTPTEISNLTLPIVFQYIYYQLCEFILGNRKGSEIMKLVITPMKIKHATYDICRTKFCRLLCEEVSIIQYGLYRLIKKVTSQRPATKETKVEDDDVVSLPASEAPSVPFIKNVKFPVADVSSCSSDEDEDEDEVTSSDEEDDDDFSDDEDDDDEDDEDDDDEDNDFLVNGDEEED